MQIDERKLAEKKSDFFFKFQHGGKTHDSQSCDLEFESCCLDLEKVTESGREKENKELLLFSQLIFKT